ncbi:MAG: DUF2203 family protein [Pseudomonadota bacterium]
MGEVIPIHSRRIFTQEEALDLLPIVRRITETVAADVSELQEQIRFVPYGEPLYKRLYSQIEQRVRRWAIKISKLGCEPRGIWLVDFDAGTGWFTWRLGDEGLAFFHSHESHPNDMCAHIMGEIPS